MKVFISWSGENSKLLAKEMKKFLKKCIQTLDVFCSEEDIEKGQNWVRIIGDELANSNYGIFCLNKENMDSEWLNFEAGAISKMISNSYVSTILQKIEISDLKGPLSYFQATKLEYSDLLKLFKSINKAQEKPINEEILVDCFDALYDGFISQINKIQILEQKSSLKESNQKNIEQTLKISEKCYDILKRMDLVLPGIVEDANLKQNIDYKEKYNIFVDKINALNYTLYTNIKEDAYKNVECIFILSTYIKYIEEIMSKDAYFKKICKNRISMIKDKFSFYKISIK